jgi:hypothetical protein
MIYLKYAITPIEFVGVCGTLGTIIWTTLLIALNFLGCPFHKSHCVQDFDGYYHIEYVPSFFQDLSGDYFLILIIIANVFILARFNYDIGSVISIGSAMVLQILTTFSNILIWVVGIAITIIGSGN